MTDAPIREEPPSPAPATASTRHFTLVDTKAPAERTSLRTLEDEGTPLWQIAAIGLTLVVVLGGLAWYFTLPPSADSLYAKISAAADEGDQQLADVEPQIDQFLVNYSGDERYDEVSGYRQELDLQRMPRQLELRARRGKNTLLPIEQSYLEAMSFERNSPDMAADRLQAIIDVYGSDRNSSPNVERWVELARRQLSVLTERLERGRAEHQKVLAGRMRDARALAGDDPESARAMCDGIITLYGDKPWAQEAVAQARELLESLKGAPRDPL
jgi:hypothetical protein